MVTGRLPRLVRCHSRQQVDEPRFADQDDLEQLLPVDFQARQQVQLLENVEAQTLGVVHDQGRSPRAAAGALPAEEIVQNQAPRVHPVRNTQLVTDDGEQRLRRRDGVGDQRHADVLGQLVQQLATDRRLADAARSDEEGDPAPHLDALSQMGERSLVALAQIDESGIGDMREGALAKAEMLEVHRSLTRWPGLMAGSRCLDEGPTGARFLLPPPDGRSIAEVADSDGSPLAVGPKPVLTSPKDSLSGPRDRCQTFQRNSRYARRRRQGDRLPRALLPDADREDT